MCGITGVYEFKKSNVNQAKYIDWALDTMHHRGPDSNGYWTNERNYHTGFVRLAIRDLSAVGNQPMHSACGRYVLVFNGEIYNTDLYKQSLVNTGVSFISTADTEVLLYGLIQWGSDILKTLNGIFAFAFYDKEKNELLLARDRMGIKPLYIGYSNEGIVYSSQYDHVINHPFCAANEIDNEAVSLYLSLGYVPDGKGMINNTQLLPHGHFVTVNNHGWQLHEYYQYPAEQQQNDKKIGDVLEQCVHQQLISDVPLGTFMSGGTDSTLVTYEATKKHRIKSFTIGVDDKHLDETDDAAAFAKFFNTEHFTHHVNEAALLSLIDKNTKAYSEPFADFSSIPTLAIAEFARKQVTVALSGDGGDELFWGYPRNRRVIDHTKLLQQPRALKYLKFLKERALRQSKTVSQRHLKADNIVDYYYQSLFIAGSSSFAKNILSNPQMPTPFFLQQALNKTMDYNNADAVMNITRKLEMDLHLQRILIKVDRASMYNSLEVRVPLLDNDMLDYSTGVSYKECIKQNQGKMNLKELLAPITNKDLVYKTKKGFDIPMRIWLNKQLSKDVEEKLMNMPRHLAVHFDRQGIQKMLKEHKTYVNDMTWLIWAMYTLVNWDAYHRSGNKKNLF